MQKISSYLYPNRIQLLADLAGFTTEFTNVYQRNLKIYSGIDNVIEFDIKNADQKRLELGGDTPVITDMLMNVMDASGNGLPNSPYTVSPTSIKGIASVTIPADDLSGLTPQFLQYTVQATKDGNNTLLYADSRFGAFGKLELVGSAVPVTKPTKTYKDFISEINLQGEMITHSPAIPTSFYEAIKTSEMNIHVWIEDFIGKIYIQETSTDTISVESFKDAPKLMEFTFNVPTTQVVHFHPLNIDATRYYRVSWENTDRTRSTSDNVAGIAGKVIKITADAGPAIGE